MQIRQFVANGRGVLADCSKMVCDLQHLSVGFQILDQIGSGFFVLSDLDP
jgi:hypothetical protein